MVNINTIKGIYEYIEAQSSFKFPTNTNIEKSFQRLEKAYKQKSFKNKCTWEKFVWGLRLDQGKILPMMSNLTKDGKTLWEYPSLKDFEIDGLKYLEYRTGVVKNPYLKARYNHILWDSKFKHKKYALNAIDGYLAYIKICLEKKIKLLDYCKSLIVLSNSSNTNIIEVNKAIINLIANDLLEDYEIQQLGNFYLKNTKIKINKDILKIIKYECIKNLNNIDDFTFPDVCDTIISISKSTNSDFKEFFIKKAEYYINLGNNENNWSRQSHYFNAILAFNEIGEKDRLDELYILIENTKEELKLGSVSKEFSGEKIQKYFKSMNLQTDSLTDLDSNSIYNYLALSNSYLPNADIFYKKPKPTFLDMVSTTTFDINNNFSINDNKKIINEYWIHISLFSIRHLGFIFRKGVEKGSISYSSLITYIYNNSWIGKTYSDNDLGGNIKNFNLIETIAPSIFDFFKLFDAEIKQEKFDNTAYILCVDSLTLKIEGLIRHFSRLIKCPTIIVNKKKNGTRERYIEEMISHPKFKEYFSDEDLIFILYVMTNKGINLRNNIAHSFYKYENYSSSLMFFLITILLRLGKFELNIKENKK